jgi:murein DD-endopeptidase MepM/ murein hydrolase activator NlpD
MENQTYQRRLDADLGCTKLSLRGISAARPHPGGGAAVTRRLLVAALAVGWVGCGGQPTGDNEKIGTTSEAVIATPAGSGPYCSMQPASGTGWGFSWGTPGTDPCANMARTSPGFAIKYAGLWSTTGSNKVLMRCSDGAVGIWLGSGDSAMSAAFTNANSNHRPGCNFIVAPTAMPIFNAPFKIDAQSLSTNHVVHATGFDYAYTPLDVSQFGQTPVDSGPASMVDHLGRDQRNSGGENNHDANDWLIDLNTPIYAVADGTVLDSRDRDVTSFGCPSPQKEIYIQHDVGTGTYRESFVSYYAHFATRSVSKGATVRKGDLIGYAGNTGCSSNNHLHLGVTRLTNALDWYHKTFTTTAGANGTQGAHGDDSYAGRIEPYGWAAPQGVDPWAYAFASSVDDYNHHLGAWSINLWSAGQSPPNTNW